MEDTQGKQAKASPKKYTGIFVGFCFGTLLTTLFRPQLELRQEAYVSTLCATSQQQEPSGNQTALITKSVEEKKSLSADECRDVFHSKGQGGLKTLTGAQIKNGCERGLITKGPVYNVCDDLRNFTGLAEDEFTDRLARKGRFHFEGEHLFWNPNSTAELAWYYSTSVDYLFANALHAANEKVLNPIASKEYEPILDYSAGVGNNIIHLASKGIKCQYFGIGMIEYNFAHYRVSKRGLDNLVEFKRPFSAKTGYKFDPINGPLPRDGSLGAIIAMDVLEHIPQYHLVVEAMVDSLRVGGIIIEHTPFGANNVAEGEKDLRVHVSNGGISMKQAMGPRMKLVKGTGRVGRWEKIAE